MHTETEVRFIVPAATREALATEMARGSASLERSSLAAVYFDTPDRRLAAAGLSWRVRREGRRWIQTLKSAGSSAIERFEHDVIRPDASLDPGAHADTPAGGRLGRLIAQARADGLEVAPRFQTRVRRLARRIRTRGAIVEVAFDEGRLFAGTASQRIREVEFERISGSVEAMLAMAERWRKRFGLVLEPRGKADRGDRLADGHAYPAVRKAGRLPDTREADVGRAFGGVLDECLAQVLHNAIGLTDGDPGLRVDHVHQMRVGMRRLRTALRCFDGWVEPPAPPLVDGLRTVFGKLGQSRDSDVLDSGVAATLARVGAPPLSVPPSGGGPDPAALLRSDEVQKLLLGWVSWRATLPARSAAAQTNAEPIADPAAVGDGTAQAPAEPVQAASRPWSFERAAERRLLRWHRRIAADLPGFDELEEEALHALRKRIKRQRYAVEFLAPPTRLRKVDRYLERLAAVQERMGELNDLLVARSRYQTIVQSDPAAWFALGWLAARIAEVKAQTLPELERLARLAPPSR